MDEGTKDDGAENIDHRIEPGTPVIEKQELGALTGSHDKQIDFGAAGSCDQPVDDGAAGTQGLEASSGSGTRPFRSILSIDAKEFRPRSQESGTTSPSAFIKSAAATNTGSGYWDGTGFQSHPPLFHSPPHHYSYYPFGYGDEEHYTPPSSLVPGYGNVGHYQRPPSPQLYGQPFVSPEHYPAQVNPDVQFGGHPMYGGTSPPLDSTGHKGGSSQTPCSNSQDNDDRSQYTAPSSQQTGSGRKIDNPVPIMNLPRMPSNKPSFSSTAKYGQKVAAELALLKNKMVAFLSKDKNEKKYGASSFGPSLQVDFLDLLYYDKGLATDVCNAKKTDEYWLREAANMFCEDNGFPTKDASIEFTNLPHRIQSAEAVLTSLPISKKVPLCENRATVHVATAHGRGQLRIVLWDTLDMLVNGESWDESLTIKDMVFAQVTEDPKSLKLLIAKRPTTRKKSDRYIGIKPLRDIWSAVEKYYKVGKNGLPLYMKQLKGDIDSATQLD